MANEELQIRKIFIKIFPVLSNSFNLDMSRNEFENWDSLTHMQLISEIEEDFHLSFDMDDIIDIEKPRDFIKIIKKKSA